MICPICGRINCGVNCVCTVKDVREAAIKVWQDKMEKETTKMDLEEVAGSIKTTGMVEGKLKEPIKSDYLQLRRVLILEDVREVDDKGEVIYEGCKRQTGEKGRIHGWFQIGSFNDGIDVVAVVEFENGVIELVGATYIQFEEFMK